jgi:hypothetical protein
VSRTGFGHEAIAVGSPSQQGKNALLAIDAAAHRQKIVWYQGLKAVFVELRAAEFWLYGRGRAGNWQRNSETLTDIIIIMFAFWHFSQQIARAL